MHVANTWFLFSSYALATNSYVWFCMAPNLFHRLWLHCCNNCQTPCLNSNICSLIWSISCDKLHLSGPVSWDCHICASCAQCSKRETATVRCVTNWLRYWNWRIWCWNSIILSLSAGSMLKASRQPFWSFLCFLGWLLKRKSCLFQTFATAKLLSFVLYSCCCLEKQVGMNIILRPLLPFSPNNSTAQNEKKYCH